MNPKVKSKWVAALLSGDYKQARGALSVNGAFCCLGVLCELAVADGVTSKTQTKAEVGHGFAYGLRNDTAVLPLEVQRWAGLGPTPRAGRFGLISLNDNGIEFAEIAQRIALYL